MHTFFAYLARMKYIQRWGLMRNSFPENDAEHTLQTVMIAHGLAVIREKIFHEHCDAEHCAILAVYHDAGEVFTGDMPTPVKYFTEDLHDKYKEIEDRIIDNWMKYYDLGVVAGEIKEEIPKDVLIRMFRSLYYGDSYLLSIIGEGLNINDLEQKFLLIYQAIKK